MANWNRETEDTAVVSFWVWIIVALVIGVLAFFLAIQPTLIRMQKPVLDAQNEVIHSSQQYVETYQARLLAMLQDYQRLDAEIAIYKDQPEIVQAKQAQQQAVLDRIRAEQTKLDPQYVPPAVARFLATHTN